MALHFKGEDIEFDLDQWAMYAIKSVQMKSFTISIQVRHYFKDTNQVVCDMGMSGNNNFQGIGKAGRS